MKNPLKKAFTLIEVLIVVAIVGIIIGIAIPAMNKAREDSIHTRASAAAKNFNEATTRAILQGDTNSVLYGNDVNALATYLIEHGYLNVVHN